MSERESPLQGKTILVTRPASQAAGLLEKLQELGARCECLPLFDIEPQSADLPADWTAFDGVIFTSRNAVRHAHGIAAFPNHGGPACLAVGPATAAELRARGLDRVIVPEDTRSEGLLGLPMLQDVADRRWLIIKGAGGRDKLAKSLKARGARVDSLNVYRRIPIHHAGDKIRYHLEAADAAMVFSGEALQHLWALCPTELRPVLGRMQLVVPAPRVVKMAQDIGFTTAPRPARRMTDTDLAQALVAALGDVETDNHKAGDGPGIHDPDIT